MVAFTEEAETEFTWAKYEYLCGVYGKDASYEEYQYLVENAQCYCDDSDLTVEAALLQKYDEAKANDRKAAETELRESVQGAISSNPVLKALRMVCGNADEDDQ